MSLISCPPYAMGSCHISAAQCSSEIFRARQSCDDATQPTLKSISTRTTHFIRGIAKKLLEQSKQNNIKALQIAFKIVQEQGMAPFQDLLCKKQSYFSRFFSQESWQEWTQYKTPLGRVISKYCEYITESTPLKSLLDLLDVQTLEIANQDAKAILQSLNRHKLEQHDYEEKPSSSWWSSAFTFPVAHAQPIIPAFFPASFDLSTLNGKNGFAFEGNTYGANSGRSVSGIGDLNGDGIQDIAVGAPMSASNGQIGQVYVIFGSKRPWTTPLNPQNITLGNGVIINGEIFEDQYGSALSGGLDSNGDNIGDIVMGANSASPNGRTYAGITYVIFGREGIWNTPFSVANLNGMNGYVLYGEVAGDYSGVSVSLAGDVNGDGLSDIIVGAPGGTNRVYSGRAYLIFGSTQTWKTPFELSSLNGINGFIMNGEFSLDRCGGAVSGAGDINGDGIADLLISAYQASPSNRTYAGRVYVVFGAQKGFWTSPFNLSSLNGQIGFAINGEQPGDRAGMSVSKAGDINNDGIDDILIGAPMFGGQTPVGRSYVIFGKKGNWDPVIELSSLNGKTGVILNGEPGSEYSGSSLSKAGDVNNDGINDIIVGALGGSPKGKITAGKSYVLYGHHSPWTSPFDLKSLNGTNGFIINGEFAGDQSGSSVSGVVDMNDDNVPDLLIGAPYASPNHMSFSGKSYVIFGSQSNHKRF